MSLIKVNAIDDLLGDASGRFFGEIYRKARQKSFLQVTLLEESMWSIVGSADVDYLANWGARKGVNRIPHLSTIDAVVFLDHVGNYIEEIICAEGKMVAMNLVLLRAGSAPDEILDGVWVSVKIIDRGGSFHAEIRIGNMRAASDYIISEEGKDLKSTRISSCLTPKVSLSNVVVDSSSSRACADIGLTESQMRLSGGVSIITNIVACSQVAQALIAALDDIPRQESNTLWMRKYEAWIPDSSDVKSEEKSEVIIDDHRVLSVGETKFSIFNGQATGCHVDCHFSLAHALLEGR